MEQPIKIVCPISLSGEPKQCHPLCRLNENGECLLIAAIRKIAKSDRT